MNNPAFANGEFYHVYNRGADKRTTFLDSQDYWRFLHCLHDFNDTNPTPHVRDRAAEVQPRQPVVGIGAFCLMPNHFHLLLTQLQEGGITLFMRKLGTGYTMYFNKRYERSGVLFQGRYKAKHVDEQRYLTHLVHYIHANPISHSAEVEPPHGMQMVDSHPWSSWHAYNGRDRFAGISDIGYVTRLLGETKYHDDFSDWLMDRSEVPREERILRIDGR